MHLAELNIGRLVAPQNDPRVADFMNNLDLINGLGKKMPGFVWIMEGDQGAGNTDTAIDGDPLLIPNMTVWEDYASLKTYIFKTLHSKFMARKAEWFEKRPEKTFVMWWIAEGHIPTLDEALDRLKHRQVHGDTDHAFGWGYIKDDAS